MKKFFYGMFVFMMLITSCSSRRGTLSSSKSGSNSKTSSSSSVGRPTMAGNDYIAQYKDIAIAEMNKYGIPASIKLAQALLESGNGNSYLAREANNHFGIKCGGVWKGKSVTRPDDNINDCFRVYDNPQQSFRDHSEFLLRPRYSALFKLDKDDYKSWAKGLKAAGYATNPRYPDLLIEMIERYHLDQYDRRETPKEKVVREEVVKEEIVQNVQETPPATVKTEEIKSPLAMRIHEVKAQETLYSLSKLYNVSVEQIKSLNGLTDEVLSLGQLLVISK
ncbi:glucosaminidase domain-containing protein [Sphingobacterium sp. ML3W]|uniref:glucosaminidase domain-containing protein n=1 Tax=Sphingobacterium sp. ML3W TaxID=1538644 RepID=UPI00249B7A4E|nr:glucosaminidase domain-containing protein [Sphingobacterium sp. ML3W]WFA78364.1 glucosaminidase domain-containing protein [Sphingobacterium sp. ML3W]